ncbi:MAG: four helix bundle protein [Acidobacteria bacterium]|nr:four helix bundle protein [Acidobacteriota bacterium]
MRNFRDLKVWGKTHDLTLALYSVTRGFPKDELYGLTRTGFINASA